MALELFLTAAGAFLGTLGFAVLVRAPKRAWSEAASIFCGSLCGSLAALICARQMKMIGTVFLMLSIVSFVPGLGLYRCMHHLGEGTTIQGANEGVHAMITIAMIVFGQGAGSFLYRTMLKK